MKIVPIVYCIKHLYAVIILFKEWISGKDWVPIQHIV